ncbi:hypothetical protein JHU38_00550 [Prevotella sp. A2931]|uniref:DUF6377 domain-containing protein n=1 Tax=Prevotella illustrans TaxID=2800387 RepID=A0ABS3M287_9BACT|nr:MULTISPECIES: DUF6377 domain-containing protein [Prevotella]MBO1362283.1 hypothetical protein [Prevotella illustrans]PTL26463.1 hypothetical protein C3V39_05020 [Prevotella sp. oral taxon 820]
MKKAVLFLFLFSFSRVGWAINESVLLHLDQTLARKNVIVAQKEERVSRQRAHFFLSRNVRSRLDDCRRLVREYLFFQYDSAKAYADRGIQLAGESGDTDYLHHFTIAKARILSIGGLYDISYHLLLRMRPDSMSLDNRKDYALAMADLFRFWESYARDPEFTPFHREKSHEWLVRYIAYLKPGTPEYDFYQAKYNIEVLHNVAVANRYYLKCIAGFPPTDRYYARSCFTYAKNCWKAGQRQRAIRYMTEAARSDLLACTRENSAIKQLAEYLMAMDSSNSIVAEKYINAALNDAKSYNNRLRLIEVSQSLPPILEAYKRQLNARKENLVMALVGTIVLLLALLLAAWLIYRKNQQLKRHRRELADYNRQLTLLNEKLEHANGRLLDTNDKREDLATLYIDLCAQYIEKLNRQQTLVTRKIKAGQATDLLSHFSSARVSSEESATFLKHFDQAFLALYPTFREELNALLLPEHRIPVAKKATLTTVQRIVALNRLGVNDSTEIAYLLFASTQTVYNRRSEFRTKVISKDTIKEDVRGLCKTYQKK